MFYKSRRSGWRGALLKTSNFHINQPHSLAAFSTIRQLSYSISFRGRVKYMSTYILDWLLAMLMHSKNSVNSFDNFKSSFTNNVFIFIPILEHFQLEKTDFLYIKLSITFLGVSFAFVCVSISSYLLPGFCFILHQIYDQATFKELTSCRIDSELRHTLTYNIL